MRPKVIVSEIELPPRRFGRCRSGPEGFLQSSCRNPGRFTAMSRRDRGRAGERRREQPQRKALVFAGWVGSSGSLCAIPLWQSMQVPFFSSTILCIFCAALFCLATVSGSERVAVAAVGRVVCLHLVPHGVCQPPPLLLVELRRGDHPARLLDEVPAAGLRLVPELLRVAVRDVAVGAGRPNAGAAGEVHALLVLGQGERLHRVARAAAELDRAGGLDHDLGTDHADGADQDADHEQREHRPFRARRGEHAPSASEEPRLGCVGHCYSSLP